MNPKERARYIKINMTLLPDDDNLPFLNQLTFEQVGRIAKAAAKQMSTMMIQDRTRRNQKYWRNVKEELEKL